MIYTESNTPLVGFNGARKNSISLIGVPGSGKSTQAETLSNLTGKLIVDFDDDELQNISCEQAIRYCERIGTIYPERIGTIYPKQIVRQEVSTIVENIKREYFLNLEEEVALTLEYNNIIFSASGSLPYSRRAMSVIRDETYVLLLEVDPDEIIERDKQKKEGEGMQILRVTGVLKLMKQGMTKYEALSCVYKSRNGMYSKYAHGTIKLNGTETKDQTTEIVRKFYKKEIESKIIV